MRSGKHQEHAKTKQLIGSSKIRRKILHSKSAKIILLLVVLYIGWVIVYNVNHSNDVAKAAAAEQARLAADPISVAGLYDAINKERAANGAAALSTINELTTAANQMCADMVAAKYLDYKNPVSGKEANSFITDNMGDLGNSYFKSYVSSVTSGMTNQTSSDVITEAIKYQATNLNDPTYNSVGWSVCQSPTDQSQKYIVAMLADKEEKPVQQAAPVNHYYQAPPVYTAPRSTSCSSYFIGSTLYTDCN